MLKPNLIFTYFYQSDSIEFALMRLTQYYNCSLCWFRMDRFSLKNCSGLTLSFLSNSRNSFFLNSLFFVTGWTDWLAPKSIYGIFILIEYASSTKPTFGSKTSWSKKHFQNKYVFKFFLYFYLCKICIVEIISISGVPFTPLVEIEVMLP